MPYAMSSRRNKRKERREINVHQNKFPKGYISTIDNSRRPLDSLSDMTNMEVVQDNVVRPRPPLVQYGTQPSNTIIGRIPVRYNGQRKMFFMMDTAGTGKLYSQTDGGAYSLIGTGGSYSNTAWAGGVQAKNKVYVYNGIQNLTYVDLATSVIKTYIALATPSISSVAKTGMAGASSYHYYRVTANNDVGESIASVTFLETSGKPRDAWIDQTDYMVVT